MPELPEVEVITGELRRRFKGKKIEKVEVYSPKTLRGVNAREFVERITGREVKDIARRGKAILFELQNCWVVIHLKINGQVWIAKERPPWARISFKFKDCDEYLYLCDSRGLLEVSMVESLKEEVFFRQMGPEPLSQDFTFDYFYSKLKKSRSKIKPLLMDQKLVAGLGNIYSAEALFRAGIRPDRSANSLSEEETKRLYLAIKDLLQDAIKHGAVVKKYFIDGNKRKDFSPNLMVYDREGQPCFKCGEKIVKVNISGRGTYFCPVCQV